MGSATDNSEIAPMPDISIVIINHNYGAFLENAIDSALAQTHPVHEVIVVDDGSTDDSKTVIESYRSHIIPCLGPNQGHVMAANTGFARSTGTAVIFLDADDFLYPSCLAEIRQVWSDSLAKVQYMLDTVDEDRVDQKLPFPYFPDNLTHGEVRRQLLTYGTYPWTVSSGNVFARTYLRRVMPIDHEAVWRSPDGYLNALAPLYGNVETIRKPLGGYRVHGKNTWAGDATDVRKIAANRGVRFDRVLCGAIIRHAEALGYGTRTFDDFVTVKRIELRLLGKRVDPDNYPLGNDTRFSLFRLGVRTAIKAPNTSPVGCCLWIVWFFVLAFAPVELINQIHKRSRSQKTRSGLARFLVGLSRGVAG